MDPAATWANAIEALKAGEIDAALAALDDLLAWADRGGFLPPGLTKTNLNQMKEGLQ